MQTNKLFSAGTERLKRLDALSDLLGTSGKQLGMNREWSARPTAQSLRGQARSLNRDGAIGLEDSFKDSTGLARPPSLGDRSLGDVIREAPFGPPAPSSQPPPEHTAIATARASRSAHAPRQRDAARDMSAAGLMMTAQTLAMKLQTPVHAADPHPPAGPLTPVQAPRRSRHHSTNPDSAPRGYPLDVGEVGIAEPERLPPPSRFANAATAHPIPSAG